jgi:hypothetical protein
MLRRAVEKLERHATLRTVLKVIVAAVLFGVLPLTYAVYRIRSHSPDAAPLDMSPSYTPDEAYAMIGRYGDDVRSFYILNAFTADTIGPALFNLTFALLLAAVLQRLFAKGSRLRYLALLLPLTALLADLTENVLLSIVVARFPERADGVAAAANIVTHIKRAAAMSIWAAIPLLSLALGVKTLLGRRPAG